MSAGYGSSLYSSESITSSYEEVDSEISHGRGQLQPRELKGEKQLKKLEDEAKPHAHGILAGDGVGAVAAMGPVELGGDGVVQRVADAPGDQQGLKARVVEAGLGRVEHGVVILNAHEGFDAVVGLQRGEVGDVHAQLAPGGEGLLGDLAAQHAELIGEYAVFARDELRVVQVPPDNSSPRAHRRQVYGGVGVDDEQRRADIA